MHFALALLLILFDPHSRIKSFSQVCVSFCFICFQSFFFWLMVCPIDPLISVQNCCCPDWSLCWTQDPSSHSYSLKPSLNTLQLMFKVYVGYGLTFIL